MWHSLVSCFGRFILTTVIARSAFASMMVKTSRKNHNFSNSSANIARLSMNPSLLAKTRFNEPNIFRNLNLG